MRSENTIFIHFVLVPKLATVHCTSSTQKASVVKLQVDDRFALLVILNGLEHILIVNVGGLEHFESLIVGRHDGLNLSVRVVRQLPVLEHLHVHQTNLR